MTFFTEMEEEYVNVVEFVAGCQLNSEATRGRVVSGAALVSLFHDILCFKSQLLDDLVFKRCSPPSETAFRKGSVLSGPLHPGTLVPLGNEALRESRKNQVPGICTAFHNGGKGVLRIFSFTFRCTSYQADLCFAALCVKHSN